MKKHTLYLILFLFSVLTSQAYDRDSLMRTLADYEGVEKAIKLNQLSADSRNADINKARFYATEALAFSTETNMTNQIGLAYKNLGICDYLEGSYTLAIDNYEKATAFFKKANNKEEQAKIYNNTAIIKNFQNDPDQAIELYQKALSVAIEINDSSFISMVYLNIGTVYDRLWNYEQALSYYKKALTFASSTGRKTSALSNIAAIYSALDKSDLAISIYQEAMVMAESSNDIWLQAKINTNLANNWTNKEEFDKAKQCIKKALELSQGGNMQVINANSYLQYANIYMREKNYKKAIQYYEIAIEKFKFVGLNEQGNSALRNISECYYELKDYQKAFTYQNIYIKLNDSIVNENNRTIVAELQEKYESEKKLNEIQKLEDQNRQKELKNAEQAVVLEQERNLQLIIVFLALLIILAGVIIALIIFKKQAAKKYKIESERTEVEQRLLRSQMNPHFIFNALSSIQSYIITNNTHDAGLFLSKFAMLIRNVLENSSQPFISIDKEIESLELYIQLEQMRYNNSFTYEIINGLDDYLVKVPPMVMQPFVENAIIHGLRSRAEKDGHIRIILKEESDKAISCKVIDNGIGREKSAELQKESKQHKSFATKLTKDRLSRFSKNNQNNYQINIIDLYSNNGEAEGTEVNITIPFN